VVLFKGVSLDHVSDFHQWPGSTSCPIIFMVSILNSSLTTYFCAADLHICNSEWFCCIVGAGIQQSVFERKFDICTTLRSICFSDWLQTTCMSLHLSIDLIWTAINASLLLCTWCYVEFTPSTTLDSVHMWIVRSYTYFLTQRWKNCSRANIMICNILLLTLESINQSTKCREKKKWRKKHQTSKHNECSKYNRTAFFTA